MPLYRGILGHSALETYYSLLLDGESIEDATQAADFVIQAEVLRVTEEEPWSDNKLEQAHLISNRLEIYPNFYRNEPFRIVAVEKLFTAPFGPDIEFGFIPDLIVEMTAGPRKGELGIVDHKFVYNWKSVEELTLDGQLPKYRKGLQLNDYPVKWIMFNQIRTRDMKYRSSQDMFRRAYGIANDISSETIWDEQKETALEIVAKDRPAPRRALAPMVCKGCFFREPCMLSLNGQDVSKLLEIDFMLRERPFKDYNND
jgi:hypothetical protein